MSLKQKETKNPFRAWLPVLGFVLALCAAAIGWYLAPGLIDWVDRQAPGFDRDILDPLIMQLAFAGFIFFVVVGFAGIVVSAALPKKKSRVVESDLKKERMEINREKARRKKRQAQLAKEAARQRSQKNK